MGSPRGVSVQSGHWVLVGGPQGAWSRATPPLYGSLPPLSDPQVAIKGHSMLASTNAVENPLSHTAPQSLPVTAGQVHIALGRHLLHPPVSSAVPARSPAMQAPYVDRPMTADVTQPGPAATALPHPRRFVSNPTFVSGDEDHGQSLSFVVRPQFHTRYNEAFDPVEGDVEGMPCDGARGLRQEADVPLVFSKPAGLRLIEVPRELPLSSVVRVGGSWFPKESVAVLDSLDPPKERPPPLPPEPHELSRVCYSS